MIVWKRLARGGGSAVWFRGRLGEKSEGGDASYRF